MSPQSFEKDDDTNAHIDFITAASVSDLVFQAGREEGCYLPSHSPCARRGATFPFLEWSSKTILLKCCKSWLGWRVV